MKRGLTQTPALQKGVGGGGEDWKKPAVKMHERTWVPTEKSPGAAPSQSMAGRPTPSESLGVLIKIQLPKIVSELYWEWGGTRELSPHLPEQEDNGLCLKSTKRAGILFSNKMVTPRRSKA